MDIKTRLIESEKTTSPGIRFYDVQELYHVDEATFIKKFGGLDQSFRQHVTTALKEYLGDLATIRRLRNLLETREHRATLAKKGIQISDKDHELAFEQHATEEQRTAAEGELGRQCLMRLERAVEAGARVLAQKAIAELRADLEKIDVIDSVLEKYGAPQTPLKSALKTAIARLGAATVKPLDLSNHYDQRINLSQKFFPVDCPIELESPPATPAVAGDAKPSTIRTAADVAAARAG